MDTHTIPFLNTLQPFPLEQGDTKDKLHPERDVFNECNTEEPLPMRNVGTNRAQSPRRDVTEYVLILVEN